MRVVAGKYRGHRLVSFEAPHLRPTTDRIKESIFNKLQTVTAGSRILDLFSGTGALAIEALSREAAHVTAVEKHPKSLKIIRENLAKLKISSGLDVVPTDVFQFLQRFDGLPFDIVLADPPFTEKLAHKVMLSISEVREKLLQPEALILIESGSHEPIEDQYPGLLLKDRKIYKDKSLSVFAKVPGTF